MKWYTNEVMAKIEIAGAPAEHLATLLAIGTFYSDAWLFTVSADWNSRSFVPGRGQIARIDERWAPKAEKGYFPGPVSRVMGYRIDRGLKLSLQPTTFKEYAGLQTNDDAEVFGIENLANPLSVSLAVLTQDEQWVMAKKRQGDRIGAIDAIGGYVNPEKDVLFPMLAKQLTINSSVARIADKSGLLGILHRRDAWRAAEREFREETGAPRASVLAMTALGLTYEHKDLNHPVLNVFVRTALTVDQLRDCAPKHGDGEVNLLFTHSPLETIQNMKDEYVDVEPDGQWSFALAQAYWMLHHGRMNVRSLQSVELKSNLATA